MAQSRQCPWDTGEGVGEEIWLKGILGVYRQGISCFITEQPLHF